jgi:hypothetical protein
MYRIIHEVLPVNYLMYNRNIYKSNKCTFCNQVETLRHLFMECKFVNQLMILVKNWLFSISNYKYYGYTLNN